MWNMDPIHWVAAGSLIVNVILCGSLYVLDLKLDKEQALTHATKVIGEAKEAETARLAKQSKKAQGLLNKSYEDTITKLGTDNQRLRKQIANSRVLPSAPQVCTEGSKRTQIDWPLIEQAIRDYRQRTRELVEEGDRCIAGLDTVKDWVDIER